MRERLQSRTTPQQMAHSAVARALRTGVLARPDKCERCEKSCKPEGHHDDYAEPLAVQWLCSACHHTRDKAAAPGDLWKGTRQPAPRGALVMIVNRVTNCVNADRAGAYQIKIYPSQVSRVLSGERGSRWSDLIRETARQVAREMGGKA